MTPQEFLQFPGLPPYLKNLLANLKLTPGQKYDRNVQATIYNQAYRKLSDQITLENVGTSGPKKPIPQKLPFQHMSFILNYFFSFKNIYLSNGSSMNKKGLLGIYLDEEYNDINTQGIYQVNYEDIQHLLNGFLSEYKDSEIEEIFNKIKREADRVGVTESKTKTVVKNGIFNRKTNELEPFSPDFVTLVKIPIDYNPRPTNPIIVEDDGFRWDVDSWIYDLADNDFDTNTLIWQVIADCLQPSYSRNRSIWFYSDKGNNGKGTLGQLIKNLLGENNYSSLSVSDFKKRFLTSGLIGVAANISDENNVNDYIDSVKDYKASITGDDIIIDIKHEQPIRFKFKGANIQMLNGLPKTKDNTSSFYRRIIIVPFIKSFTNNGERPKIKTDYIYRKEVLEYVLYKALHMDFEEYIQPERTKEFLEEYKEINNPILQFWNEFEDEFQWDLLPTQFLYDLYIAWAKRNKPTSNEISKRTFTDGLKQVLCDNPQWELLVDRNKNIRTGNLMDKDEPLITDYKLDTPWINVNYKGSKLEMLRNFPRKPMYRGVRRIIN